MKQNPFLLDIEEYKRSVNPIRDYLKQTATYASIMLDKPYEDCYKHIEQKFKDKKIEFDDPVVTHYARSRNGDTDIYHTPLSRYIASTMKNNFVLAPTGTTYLHASVKPSKIVKYQDVNVQERNRYKKLSQKYEAEGNKELAMLYHNFQDNKKRRNNAVSGLFAAKGSPIQNPSAHTTLTSTTRTLSSLSNASNERLIEGNRHYFNPQIALNNCISIVSETDENLINQAMSDFGLVYPTVEDVMTCIKRSLRLYSIDTKGLIKVRDFVERISPAHRAAIVYTGDLYHIRIHNEDFTYRFLTELSTRAQPSIEDDMVSKIFSIDDSILNYAAQIMVSMLAGKGKDYEEKLTLEEQSILLNTCRNIVSVIEKYKVFLRAFFLTRNSPCTISNIASMQRRSVVLSDTDSTMFSTESWVFWYFEKYNVFNDSKLTYKQLFDDIGYAVGGSVMFMATQSIGHLLALFSANMNVETKRLFTLQMKPEYMFPVFGLTSVAKHYYTAMKIKEGNVYPTINMEIKGVHMKDSTVPADIIGLAADEMEDIITTLMSGEKINLQEKVKTVVELEEKIINSLRMGEVRYLKRTRIKEATAYKHNEHRSPYQFARIWQECFGAQYGDTPQVPYQAYAVPLRLKNKTDVTKWLDSMVDKDIAASIAKMFERTGKTHMKTFPVPADIIENGGIPKELLDIIDYERVVLSLTKSLRNVLESLGFFPKYEKMVSSQVLLKQ